MPALNEFELIRRFFTYPARHAVLGVGDDAAIVRARRGQELVVTTDMLVAGRHFRHGADPEQLGHKALAVNLSDIAAMGATPRWAMLALALPRADARWLAAFSTRRAGRSTSACRSWGRCRAGARSGVTGLAPATTFGFPVRWAMRRSRWLRGGGESPRRRANGGR